MICCSEPGSGCQVRAIRRRRSGGQEKDVGHVWQQHSIRRLQLVGHMTSRLHDNTVRPNMAYYLAGRSAE